jgi:hypothetical protein
MGFVDRYLDTLVSDQTWEKPEKIISKKQFQLLSLTSLYLAVKVDGSSVTRGIGIETMVALSRNVFSVKDIEAMEVRILKALHWKMHLPTSYVFLRHYLSILPVAVTNRYQFARILDSARYSLELSVLDYYFVSQRPSQVALASLLKVLQAEQQTASHQFLCSFIEDQKEAHEVAQCQNRLWQLHANVETGSQDQDSEHEQQTENTAKALSAARVKSPTCVGGVNSDAFNPY